MLTPFCLWNMWITRNKNLFNNKKDVIDEAIAINQAMEYHILVAQKEKKSVNKLPSHLNGTP
ncbi:hypothetical protein R3W88_019673 [Solanum pinnatisectum]|uniref:Uncharacterized protein n=1 Tax=Solanum pinnatisectum TaxID=50273 RepID=A0AAV9KKL3_9SOLN|nr:hypothetical protein R3W88_019673 [Solanum pinnatisectum]